MRGEIVGYILMCGPKDDEAYGWPMSYGDGKHEFSCRDLLLRDRGATLFASKTEAMAALKDTMKRAKDAGHTWMGKYSYSVVEVYSNVVEEKE